MAALTPGTNAPPLSLPDRDTGEARELRTDKLGLLAFFKVSCPTCQLAMPYVERFAPYVEHGLDILTVAEDAAGSAVEFAERYGTGLPVALDLAPYRASAAYGLTNVPTVFVIEPGGKIVRTQVAFSKSGYNEISQEIARRLGVTALEVCPPNDGAPEFKPG